jgi:regulator of sirC expression with transglutaminase-like and TPR domain
LLENAANVGEIHFFQGEMHRLRGDKDKKDSESAAAAYDKAISLGGAPTEVHRSLGQVYWRMGQNAKARAAFERYLGAEPDAHDRAMIEAQIARMRKG